MVLRAPVGHTVGHTCVGSCQSVRRGGHIDQRNQRLSVGPESATAFELAASVDQTGVCKAKADLLSTQIGSSGGVDNLYNEKMRLGGDGRR